MKPPKPRISKPRLAWKWDRYKDQWQPYHRVTWTEGGKRRERAVKLDWQGDPQELDRLYWQCQTGKHNRQTNNIRYSWRALIVAWRSDPRVQSKLAESTKASYRKTMDAILEKNGGKDVRKTTRAGVRAIHSKLSETPREADKRIQVISLLWNFGAKKLDWPLGENPASGIEKFGRQREYEPWPEWMVKKLDTAPERVRTAAMLILGTGQRPNAAITMRHDQFDGEWMRVRDEKGKKDLEVYCPEDLRAYLDTLPKRGAHIIAKNPTEPLSYWSIASAFSAWRSRLDDSAKAYSLHGLRKLSIIRLAEAGCSDAEIQAVTGQGVEMVAYYRARASRKTLSRAAQKRRDGA